ncbi:MAG: DMT family transporter [Geminicoccaceae bacterium]
MASRITLASQPVAPRDRLIGTIAALTAVTIMAGWMVITRLGVGQSLNAADLAFLRFATAGLLLAPVVLWRGLAFKQLGWIGFLALTAGAGAPYALIAAQGLNYAPAAHAGTFIPGAMPLFVILILVGLFGTRLSRQRWLGVTMVTIGIVMLAGQQFWAADGDQAWIGHGFFLVAALFWASYTVAMRAARLNPLHASAIVTVVSALLYSPVYLVVRGTAPLMAVPPGELVLQVVYQGLVTSVILLIVYGVAIAKLGAARGAIFASLVPVITPFIAIPILGEWPVAIEFGEMVLVAIGVALASGWGEKEVSAGGPEPANPELVSSGPPISSNPKRGA